MLLGVTEHVLAAESDAGRAENTDGCGESAMERRACTGEWRAAVASACISSVLQPFRVRGSSLVYFHEKIPLDQSESLGEKKQPFPHFI